LAYAVVVVVWVQKDSGNKKSQATRPDSY